MKRIRIFVMYNWYRFFIMLARWWYNIGDQEFERIKEMARVRSEFRKYLNSK